MTLDLKAIKERAEKATMGPWYSVPVMLAGSNETSSWSDSTGRLINGPPQTIEDETLSKRWFTRKEDGDFIAAGRTDIPALCNRIEELEAALREIADRALGPVPGRIVQIEALARKALESKSNG